MTHGTTSRTRRLVTTLTGAGLAVALAGCGTGVDAQTHDWYDPTDGVNNSVESTLDGMAVRSVVVVSDGTDATVVGTFVNYGDDADGIDSITVDGQQATITGDLDVAPTQAVRLGPPGEARAQVDGVGLEPGATATVQISFDAAPQATLTAVVRPTTGEFEDSGPE